MTKITEMSSPGTSYSDLYISDFAKKMLKTQLFIGTYQEKRFVESLNSYRDVVIVNRDEVNFINNLITVKRRIKNEDQNESLWIGITNTEIIGAPAGCALWVTLPIDVFGTYWFEVKSVDFRGNEVKLRLKVIREIKKETVNNLNDQLETDIKLDLLQSLKKFYEKYITWENIQATVKFLSLLIATILLGSVNSLKFLAEYLIKLLYAMSEVIRSSTPIVLKCVDLLWKTIYGFMALIVVLFTNKPHRPSPGNQNYYFGESRRLIPLEYNRPYRSRSSVIIEPVE
ncbi:hypothetical protein ABEB36_004104 [Hypothenemus hampei]|uniref:Uncharacterized protein n=1 Tax=Hypothenemus hampei TaxID=57062 RepID=A0ABD1F3K5_HYPHA